MAFDKRNVNSYDEWDADELHALDETPSQRKYAPNAQVLFQCPEEVKDDVWTKAWITESKKNRRRKTLQHQVSYDGWKQNKNGCGKVVQQRASVGADNRKRLRSAY